MLALHRFPSFADGFMPRWIVGSTTKSSRSRPASAPPGVVRGGDQIGPVFADRPEVRAVVKFTATPVLGRSGYGGH